MKTGDFFDIDNEMKKRKIIAIIGPTASGKTGWGVAVARKYNGEIISADSRQVYKKLDIGTGKDLEEYGEIKHHLINICRPGEKFTMFDWLECARAVIEDIFSRGKTPIIVGGTGLYVQSLVEGFELAKNLKFKAENSYTRKELEKKTLKELNEIVLSFKLKTLNFKLDTQNPHRLIRAIERAQSGEVLSKKKPDFEVLEIAIDLPREVLYQRIDQRVEDWFVQGFIREVKGLLKSGVDPKWLESIGLEYRLLTQYLLKNRKTKELKNDPEFLEMKQKMKFAIHAYARRQLTWFRRFPEVVWYTDMKSAEKEIRKFLL